MFNTQANRDRAAWALVYIFPLFVGTVLGINCLPRDETPLSPKPNSPGSNKVRDKTWSNSLVVPKNEEPRALIENITPEPPQNIFKREQEPNRPKGPGFGEDGLPFARNPQEPLTK